MYNFSDPSKIGPGAWFFMHVMAKNAIADEDKRAMVRNIKLLCENFGCSVCSGHCKEYVKNHPPERVINVEDGLFRWTIDFRNAVQRRLGRDNLYDYATMNSIFTTKKVGVCLSGDCGGDPAPRQYMEHLDDSDTIEVEISPDIAEIIEDRYSSLIRDGKTRRFPNYSGMRS